MNKASTFKNLVGVNLIGYSSSPLGLGEDLRQAATAFLNGGLDVNIIDIETGSNKIDDSLLKPYYSNSLPHPISIFFLSPFSYASVVSQTRLPFNNTYTIGNFLWELENFPMHWAHTLAAVDEVWVPTGFVRDIYNKIGCDNVYLNPTPALPPALNSVSFRSSLGYDTDTFVFGFMFDLHSTLQRKNPLGLVRAYEKFKLLAPPRAKSALLIKVHRSDIPSEELRALKQYCSTVTGVHLYEQTLDSSGVVGFYNTIDAYISLHRSEGLGRTIIEAAQMGLPVICTAYSGSLDIIDLSDVTGVPFLKTQCKAGEYPNCDNSVWAEPSIEIAAILMNRLVRHGRHRLPTPERLNKHFSEHEFFKRSISRFNAIAGTPPSKRCNPARA